MTRVLLVCLLAVAGCTGDSDDRADTGACADYDPRRNAYFGDLHVHTGFSFDARAYDNLLTPADAYRFAAGQPVELAPLDAPRTAQIDRPLDFVAVTDHGEFLGEIATCTTPGASGYESPMCVDYRDPDQNGALAFGLQLSFGEPTRVEEVCGAGGRLCLERSAERWGQMRKDAADAYARCELTTFPAYEYTNTFRVSNLHRNVVFAGDSVPERPVTYFEAPTPPDLWRLLERDCRSEGQDCDVVVLPHNSNLSNGQLFYLGETDAETAALRARMEPIVEVFQHKGDSECRSAIPGSLGDGDPLCAFEKQRPPSDPICPDDEPGSGGMRLSGCSHRLDFVRDVLGEGLAAEAGALGSNPYRLGFIGSTDTHNGTPGHVQSEGFPGHIGKADARPQDRLGAGNVTHDGIINNPGGLAAVWAEENTREAIFAALRRRETFATSGPRIRLRLYLVRGLAEDVSCDDVDALLEAAEAAGVAMGSQLPPGEGTPTIVAIAHKDRVELDGLEAITVSLGADGLAVSQVTKLASGPADSLCAVTPVDASTGLVYLRAYEAETDRWSVSQCDALPAGHRTTECDAGLVADRVRQRAWSSPIWF